MSGMIQLHSFSRHEPIWLRCDHIVGIRPGYYPHRDGTTVQTASGEQYEVSESPEDILKMMEGKDGA